MTTIEKILADYENGTITERERVIALARVISPETVESAFASIPPMVGEELLKWASSAPLEGGVMIGGELSQESGRKLAEQLRGAVIAIRTWKEGRERGAGGRLQSEDPSKVGLSPVHPFPEKAMSAQPVARGFLLELAAEGIAPVISGCAGAFVAGPVGAAGGAVVGSVVEKVINYFGPKIVEKWIAWFRGKPKNAQIEAMSGLGAVSVHDARQVAENALNRLAPSASPEDKALALEYIAAIPEVVQQSLVADLTSGRKTVPPNLSLESPLSLMQLLPTDAPPYAAPMKLPETDYLLKRVIGTGGFGVVYEAEMPTLQHLPLAIKFCLDPSMVDMLKRERDNLKTLSTSGKENWSPRIVRLYGYKLDHATPFLVYEFVPGGTLTSYLAKRREEIGGNLPPDEVLGLIRQITEGLAFAHERGLVHRDLKPANVLVDGETLKLADFGIGGVVAGYAVAHSQIGRSMVEKLNADEQVSLLRGSGTPLYMDPEQRRGGAPNPKHDLYSLGVMWYQLLIGDVTRELHAGWAKELASRFNVPKDHTEIIEQCVGWVDDRPNNAGELLNFLQSLSTTLRQGTQGLTTGQGQKIKEASGDVIGRSDRLMTERELVEVLGQYFHLEATRTERWTSLEWEGLPSGYGTKRVGKVQGDGLYFTIGETKYGEEVGLNQRIREIITEEGLTIQELPTTAAAAGTSKMFPGFAWPGCTRAVVQGIVRRVLDNVASAGGKPVPLPLRRLPIPLPSALPGRPRSPS